MDSLETKTAAEQHKHADHPPSNFLPLHRGGEEDGRHVSWRCFARSLYVNFVAIRLSAIVTGFRVMIFSPADSAAASMTRRTSRLKVTPDRNPVAVCHGVRIFDPDAREELLIRVNGDLYHVALAAGPLRVVPLAAPIVSRIVDRTGLRANIRNRAHEKYKMKL